LHPVIPDILDIHWQTTKDLHSTAQDNLTVYATCGIPLSERRLHRLFHMLRSLEYTSRKRGENR